MFKIRGENTFDSNSASCLRRTSGGKEERLTELKPDGRFQTPFLTEVAKVAA